MGLNDRIDCWLYPELKQFPSEERKRVLKECFRQTKFGWTPYVISGLCMAMLYAWLGMLHQVGVTLASLVALGILALQMGLLSRDAQRRIRPRLKGLLMERGIRQCGACGYDLTGNISGTCPECGQCITAGAVERPMSKPLRRLLVGLGVLAFFVFAVWSFVDDWKSSHASKFYRDDPARLLLVLGLTLAATVGLLLFDCLRRRWRRHSQDKSLQENRKDYSPAAEPEPPP